MPDERRVTISSGRHLSPDEIARRTFATGRRGFEPSEVRAFLDAVARELALRDADEQALREELARAEHRASNPVLDDSTLTAALGAETARVLRAAHESASELLAKAQAQATELLSSAREESDRLRGDAEEVASRRTAQADEAAAEIHRRVQAEVAARIEEARRDAQATLDQAREECRGMVHEAQELRTRVLADLARRRRGFHAQIEQLRAGRESLASVVSKVRDDVDRIAGEVFRAESEARAAAERVGREVSARPDDFADVVVSEPHDPATERAEPRAGVAPVGASPSALEVESSTAVSDPVGDEAAPVQMPVVEAAVPGEITEVTPPPGTGGSEPSEIVPTAPGADGLLAAAGSTGAEAGRSPAASVLPVDPDVEGTGSAPEVQESGHGVDDIFARLRAERLGEGAEPGPTAEVPAPAEVAEPVVVAEPGPSAPPSAVEAAGGAAAEQDDRLTRRDELLAPLVSSLTRRLKRAFKDDQNDVLDRLRSRGGWAEDLLPEEAEHAGRYQAAVSELLGEAARAGAQFAGAKPDDAPAGDAEAAAMAGAVVASLRQRLGEAGPDVVGGDEAAAIEQVGAAYREWRGTRVERLVGDHVTAAFSAAVVACSSSGLEWLVDDDGVECPDCDDNALAGTLSPGDTFPTGHVHPPAHAGCRCLLVSATA